MIVVLPVATTVVDPRMRAAFSPACLDSMREQLNVRSVPVTYEYRARSVAGCTVIGTARIEDRDLVVEADLSPPWWTEEELAAALPTLGGGVAGKVLRDGTVGPVHVTEQILVTEVSLLQLHTSANSAKPARRV